MTALEEKEIEKLFSGAPQFFARSLGHATGAPHPSVAFPWDEDLTIRDQTDHVQIDNDAWGCVTAGPRIIIRDPMSPMSPSSKSRPHFNVRTMERPNMLSMQGLEKGTLGYQAALEMSVADTQFEEQYGFDSLGSKGRVIVEARQKLITSKDGLRHLDDASLMEQLLHSEQRYYGDRTFKPLRGNDLYNELFTKILHPPSRVIDPKNPYSFAVQIHALVKVLATANVWVDFSRVEWRLRLGQVLWGFPLDDEVQDGLPFADGHDNRERAEERYWLLLQILLSCELLIRLDAITEGDEFGAQNLKSSEIHRFEKEANLSVKWSLLLARCWLENISITKNHISQREPSTPKGWLNALTNKMHLMHDHMYGAHHTDHTQHRQNPLAEHIYGIKGRYTQRQFLGLSQFARRLRWPDLEANEARICWQSTALNDTTEINTPIGTADTRQSSYFEGERRSVENRRQPPKRRKVEAALHAHGWLSKSYASGLVLPGETLPHFIMAALIENDQEAIDVLGQRAALSGGFTYKRRSFWSTACVLGRVLAAGYSSEESVGWISTEITPQGFSNGWFSISVKDIQEDLAKTGKKARIWGKTLIERDSDVTGDSEPGTVLPADFFIPFENTHSQAPPSNIRIEFKSLLLSAPMDGSNGDQSPRPVDGPNTPVSGDTPPPDVQTHSASIAFNVTHDGEEQRLEYMFSLLNDVYFVTAYPCKPSSKVRLFRSPTSPTIQQVDVGGRNLSGKSNPESITGHPLHKNYKYTSVHLLELIKHPDLSMEEIFQKYTTGEAGRPDKKISSRVLVIDCITGIAPSRSPDLPSLSPVSSLSSSMNLEPTVSNGGVPQLQMPPGVAPPTPTSPTEPRQRRPSTAGTANSVGYERVDPPASTSSKRKRRYGSDMEILVRALCAERGWNALISRRRRGCLACAIREAGALGWKVVIRVN